MNAWLCHSDDGASPRTMFYNVSLKIVKVNVAVLSTRSQLSKETRYSGGGVGAGKWDLLRSNSFVKSFACILKTDFLSL